MQIPFELNLQINAYIASNKDNSQEDLIEGVKSEFGISLSREAVRKRLSRMKTKIALEAAELGVDPDSIRKMWCRGKSATFEVVNSPNLEKVKEEMDSFFKSVEKTSKDVKYKRSNKKHLLVVDPADVHFGKLGLPQETNDSYNLKVAAERLNSGVMGLIDKASGFPIEKVLLITGNDILHVDNPKRTTTSGTPQDTDGMFWEAYKEAQASLMFVIDKLLKISPVDVMYCPSNHDFMSGFMLIDSLSMAYASNKHITFDCDMRHRKYYKYGQNLICGSHGDGMKMGDMPLIMAEESKMWDSTKFRYCYLHHFHSYKKQNWRSGEDFLGTTVEFLRSMSGMDRWTSTNFGKSVKAVEGFIHHPEQGQICKISNFF